MWNQTVKYFDNETSKYYPILYWVYGGNQLILPKLNVAKNNKKEERLSGHWTSFEILQSKAVKVTLKIDLDTI